MQKQFYFLSPVEVVKVSSSNLQEVAEWCGGKVAQTESRRVAGRMDSYVWVPTPKGSNISWAFPGMFITKRLVVTVKGELRATWAVFRRDYFEKNYFDTPLDATNKTWELEDRSAKPKEVGKLIDSSPGEPVVQPPVSTLDVEEMDDETRERIEQVNQDIVRRGLVPVPPKGQPQQAGEHEAVVEAKAMDLAVQIVKEELGGELIQVTPTGQVIIETDVTAVHPVEVVEEPEIEVIAEKRL